MTLKTDIDFDSILGPDPKLKPAFANDVDYKSFRRKFREHMQKELKEQAKARRASEQLARARLLG